MSSFSSYVSSFTAQQMQEYEARMKTSTSPTDAPPVTLPLAIHSSVLISPPHLEEEHQLHTSSSENTLVPEHANRNVTFDIEKLQLPAKRQSRIVRLFRHTLLNVYRRLFSIVFIANAVALVVFLAKSSDILHVNIWNLATAASANVFVATAIRQDYVQNILYYMVWLTPQSAPLRVRRVVAKLYENGGVHSGCGIAGTLWFAALTIILSVQFVEEIFTSRAVLTVTWILQALLLLIVGFAYPTLRARYHNIFEISHRFAGWAVVILFWVELGLLSHTVAQENRVTAGHVLIRQPSFWLLMLITFHAVLPWLFLRRWEFRAEGLTKHAVRLHFERNVGPCTGIAISKSPLLEWHPFATLPSLDPTQKGGSVIVSRAGDWTKSAVEEPRSYYWVKGVPKPGVLGLSLIFKSVVIVTTGSGIGPCLSIIASPTRRTACRILWTGPRPEQTFGSEIVHYVRQADPEAMIIDSKKEGRPDMVALSYRLYVEAKAEAVFVISNPALTRKIVYSLESRGVPAFGPIWDS
ncbi:hypothetical protein DPSP01_007853 [Paraphaeosphaeria sporulosa]|uniref:Integral membrane protein TmpA n=1 Tax=Paraphaeosphaeria sporulosa TaxID=1460663 RepID=A0A177CKD1_9PLEO|nr:uncharacterized protein CC84DRAFT_1163538 [Paraphaeosphaeria sporulosa]OAG07328.1 hypothetical protein CC84DRAFT_1163538 [Paraphaeosphaeria sporulosa]